jgi:hypothetical protein
VANISVFVFGEISLNGEKRKPVLIVQGIFFGGKKLEKSPYFEEKISPVAIFRP